MKKSKTKHPCHDCDGCTYEHAALHERVAKLESRVPAIEVMQRFDWNKMRTVLDRLAALERALKPSVDDLLTALNTAKPKAGFPRAQ